MDQTTAIRFLIVDDHAIAQQGLAVILNKRADIKVVSKAKDGIEAINLHATTKLNLRFVRLMLKRLAYH